MTDSANEYPKPNQVEENRLYDAAWDLRDYGEAWIELSRGNPEKWLYWLKRYEGFAEGELELDGQNQWNFKIKLKD